MNGRLSNTEQSRICEACWVNLSKHYSNCALDLFVIMPNHVHGIIFINNMKNIIETGLKPVSTLSEIIRGFKTFTAREINRYQQTPGIAFWQSGFYDRIIRNDKELRYIRQYIQHNPMQWDNDRNNVNKYS